MRPILKWLLIVDILAVVIIAGWLLFGWKTDTTETGMRRYYRVFGVYTRIAVDSSNDGSWNAIAYYRRGEPADLADSKPYHFKEDRDSDGRFDLWVETAETSDGLTYRWKVDLEGDGQPDWEFLEADYSIAYASISERRGY